MTTIHQYLDGNPIDPVSERLIVGTIHPHDHANFKVPFFYGNECSLWMILHEAFPTELINPYSLADIRAFLLRRKMSVRHNPVMQANKFDCVGQGSNPDAVEYRSARSDPRVQHF